MFNYKSTFLISLLCMVVSTQLTPIKSITESMEEHAVVPDVIDVAPTELLKVISILINIHN